MTFIDFQPSTAHNHSYAKLASGYSFEVIFPSGYAPGDQRFDWLSLPFLGARAAGRSVQSLYPLKSALWRCRSSQWIAVMPSVREATVLSRWARKNQVRLQLWLDESQSATWLWYVVVRALGSGVTAEHWMNGAAELRVADKDEKREAA